MHILFLLGSKGPSAMVTLPLLTYHSIDNTGSCLSTAPEVFSLQMQYLAGIGYRTLTVSEAVSYLKGECQFPHPAIALTFDDGYRSVFDIALPLLREHGFRATLFVVSGSCGGKNIWDGSQRAIPEFGMIKAEEIRELARAGWEIGAHSVSHARLTTLGDEELEREMQRCQLSLQDITRRRIRCLAYPYGAHDQRVRSRARAFFDAACGTELGFAGSASDPLALQRIDSYYLRPSWLFRSLQAAWMADYLTVRRWVRQVQGK
jgi:peptidoglycan/xylan/chitin deacetylase (PgdA/CDA1 family)